MKYKDIFVCKEREISREIERRSILSYELVKYIGKKDWIAFYYLFIYYSLIFPVCFVSFGQ